MKKRENMSAIDSFFCGSGFRSHDYFGSHREGERIAFRVFAPNAEEAFVVGDFNSWDESLPMERVEGGIFEASLNAGKVASGSRYKFKFKTEKGDIYRSDPFARFYDGPPEMASRFYENDFAWRDGGWMSFKERLPLFSRPMNIYSLHFGSWRRKENGGFYGYAELAKILAPYIKKMGYTHVQLMPLSEHCDYSSLGYRVCGCFAPSSRYGEPSGLCEFVDYMHRAGIGVIFEWSPIYMSDCKAGLSEFDGSRFYEADGSLRFDIGRPEVRSFLLSSAVFWAENFHADGLCVRGVSKMLSQDPIGEGFLSELCITLGRECPKVITVADAAPNDVRLIFDLKYDSEFEERTLAYASARASDRAATEDKLIPRGNTSDDGYIVPPPFYKSGFSGGSLIDSVRGDYLQKFASVRAFFAYAACVPGKKLNFMGAEIGQFDPFTADTPEEWFLLDFESHKGLLRYFEELNHFYLASPALYAEGKASFFYHGGSVFSITRRGCGQELVAFFNFSDERRENVRLAVSSEKSYSRVFSSERREFGGSGEDAQKKLYPQNENGQSLIKVNLSPLGCAIYEKNKQ